MLNPVALPPSRDRIADDRHDDRCGCGRALERLGRRRPARNEDVNVARHKVRGERGEPLDFVLPPFPLDLDRPPLDMAEVPQPIEECLGAKRK